MKQSKLYRCPGYYLLIYPTEPEAPRWSNHSREVVPSSVGMCPTAAGTRATMIIRANYWSKELNCSVRFAEPNEIFMCLNEPKDEFAHVLFREKQGWIIIEPWITIEEIE